MSGSEEKGQYYCIKCVTCAECRSKLVRYKKFDAEDVILLSEKFEMTRVVLEKQNNCPKCGIEFELGMTVLKLTKQPEKCYICENNDDGSTSSSSRV